MVFGWVKMMSPILNFTNKKPKYLRLIERETKVLRLFNENKLKKLADRRISGAFIVNMIKLLKTYKAQNVALTETKLQEILNFSINGFYKSNVRTKGVCFSNLKYPD